MKQVLVTGGTGFIGSHLVETLIRRGDRVRCLVRDPARARRLEELGAECIRGDVTEMAALRPAVQAVDVVYHVAGLLAALRPEHMLHVNAVGSGLVAQACAEMTEPPVLVLVSSLAAAGPVRAGTVRREEDPLSPISVYGQSKREGELAAARWAERVPMTVVRPGVVFGPACREFRPMLSTIYRLRVHPVPGWRRPPLSYIHVSDLVDVLIAAAERGRRVKPPDASRPGTTGPAGFYFAEAGEYPDWGEFGRMFARAIGRPRAPVVPLPAPIPWCVGAVSQAAGRLRGRAPLLNVDKIREARASSWACSSTWTRRDLGFRPGQSLESRVRDTARWFQEHGWL